MDTHIQKVSVVKISQTESKNFKKNYPSLQSQEREKTKI